MGRKAEVPVSDGPLRSARGNTSATYRRLAAAAATPAAPPPTVPAPAPTANPREVQLGSGYAGARPAEGPAPSSAAGWRADVGLLACVPIETHAGRAVADLDLMTARGRTAATANEALIGEIIRRGATEPGDHGPSRLGASCLEAACARVARAARVALPRYGRCSSRVALARYGRCSSRVALAPQGRCSTCVALAPQGRCSTCVALTPQGDCSTLA